MSTNTKRERKKKEKKGWEKFILWKCLLRASSSIKELLGSLRIQTRSHKENVQNLITILPLKVVVYWTKFLFKGIRKNVILGSHRGWLEWYIVLFIDKETETQGLSNVLKTTASTRKRPSFPTGVHLIQESTFIHHNLLRRLLCASNIDFFLLPWQPYLIWDNLANPAITFWVWPASKTL